MQLSRAIALASALIGFAPGFAAAQQSTLHDAILAVPAVSMTFSLQYLADDLGLWQKHGLRVKSQFIAGVGSSNAVIAGSADMADASPPTVTRAAAHGQKLEAIATLQNRLFVELVLRKDLAPGFDPKAPLAVRARFLKGRTIAVDSINSIIHAYVMLVAHRGGVPADSIQIAPMAPPAMLAAFKSGRSDGYDMSLPWPLVPVL
ncbi:MAG: ABC transporter substrate-binding protein, partial [Stellaceae bacterium]